MKPLRLLLLLLAFPLLRAVAAPLALDLGNGLAYRRASTLPADLPSASPAKAQPLVLDLRYATGDTDAAVALSAWLKFRAAPRTPVFVLANAETSPALRAVFADRDHTAGLIVLGVPAPDFEPDLPLAIEPAADRRAYTALENGVPLATLIAPTFEKVRNDEASLVAQRLPERLATPTEDSAAPAPTSTPAPAAPIPPPPVDAVLQRAVHLHRALLALKKL